MLNLLAETNGPATALRVFAIFDSGFRKDLSVPEIKFPHLPAKVFTRSISKNISVDDGEAPGQTEEKVCNLEISFEHAVAEKGILAEMMKERKCCMYTVEIIPPTKKTSIVAVNVESAGEQPFSSNPEEVELAKQFDNVDKTDNGEIVTLEDLELSKEYTICINTVVDGKTLARKVEKFGPIKPKTE